MAMNFSAGILHARDVYTHFELCGKSFLSLHTPDLMIIKVTAWCCLLWQVLLGKGKEGGSVLAPSSDELSDCIFVVMQQTLCPTLRRCAIRVFLWCGHPMVWAQIFHVSGYPIHKERLWTDYLGHLTPAELCGTPILWGLDPHVISDQVIAVTGT